MDIAHLRRQLESIFAHEQPWLLQIRQELKKIIVTMHNKSRELIELHKRQNLEPNEQLIVQKQNLVGAIRVCEDIIADVLNYWRYMPENALALKHRLEAATQARDQETAELKEELKSAAE